MITFYLHYVYGCVVEVDIDVVQVSCYVANILFHFSYMSVIWNGPLRHVDMKDVAFI